MKFEKAEAQAALITSEMGVDIYREVTVRIRRTVTPEGGWLFQNHSSVDIEICLTDKDCDESDHVTINPYDSHKFGPDMLVDKTGFVVRTCDIVLDQYDFEEVEDFDDMEIACRIRFKNREAAEACRIPVAALSLRGFQVRFDRDALELIITSSTDLSSESVLQRELLDRMASDHLDPDHIDPNEATCTVTWADHTELYVLKDREWVLVENNAKCN